LHQICKLIQCHTRDRQHICFGLKSGPAVFASQHIGQAFQHIDANRSLARRAVAAHCVVTLGRILNRWDGDQSRGWCFGEILQSLGQRPEHQPQPSGRRLEEKRHENIVLPEPHAMFSERATGVLVKVFDLLYHRTTGQDAKGFDKAKRKPTRQTRERLVLLHRQKRFKQGRNLAVNKVLKPSLHLFGNIRVRRIINKNLRARF